MVHLELVVTKVTYIHFFTCLSVTKLCCLTLDSSARERNIGAPPSGISSWKLTCIWKMLLTEFGKCYVKLSRVDFKRTPAYLGKIMPQYKTWDFLNQINMTNITTILMSARTVFSGTIWPNPPL